MADFVFENLLPYWYMWTVGVLLAVISVGFVLRFVRPAAQIGRQLAASLAALEMIKRRSGTELELEEIGRRAMNGGRLPHLWREYVDTLHAQPAAVEPGGQPRRQLRATTLAETFFSEQALVDTPLKTEFYKHLPGILTGLGIIGTFTGLIIGLIHFDVSLDPSQAQAQLAKLISSVGHAFFVSAAAITLAMLFTWIEKSLITSRYRQVEELQQAIDALFSAGAGEEYLERLVVSSEGAATQVAELKTLLLAELRSLSQDYFQQQSALAQQKEAAAERQAGLLERQLQRQSRDLAAELSQVLEQRLAAPIADIAAAVRTVGADQGEAVNRLLSEVLGRFSTQLQASFDGQTQGVGQLLSATSQMISSSAAQFAELTTSMDQAGRGTAAAMAASLEQALAAVARREQQVDGQVGELVAQVRGLIAESQAQAGRGVEQLATRLGEQVETVVSRLQEQSQLASANSEAQLERISRQSDASVSGLAGQLERLLAHSTEATQGLQATAATLSQVTVDAIRGMNAGADTLYLAASDFAKAGQGVASTMGATVAASSKLEAAAQTLAEVSLTSQEMLADYARSRDLFAQMVVELKTTIANARREASLTAELVDGLQAASGQLAAAQRKSEDYLKSVSEVLTKAHQAFAENIERTLRDANRQFHKEMAQAVGLLSGAIKDLGDTIDDLPVRG